MNVELPEDASLDDCEHVLERVYQFLDNEVDEATGDAIRHQIGVVRRLLPGVPGSVADLQPPQPLYIGVALKTGKQ